MLMYGYIAHEEIKIEELRQFKSSITA